MNDDRENLRRALADLQTELDEIREVDPAITSHLDAAIHRVKTLLAQESDEPSAAPDHDESLAEQFNSAVLKVEASHPTLAQTLGSVIDALGQMGI